MDKEAWCAAVQRLQRVGDNLVTEQQQLSYALGKASWFGSNVIVRLLLLSRFSRV